MGYYISCRYILLQKKLDLKVVKLYPLHSQGSFVFVHSIRIISLKMSDSTKERFYFIQNKFIWNYFYTIGDYNKYLNTIRELIGRCNRYFRRWLYFNPSGFRYDPKTQDCTERLLFFTPSIRRLLKEYPVRSSSFFSNIICIFVLSWRVFDKRGCVIFIYCLFYKWESECIYFIRINTKTRTYLLIYPRFCSRDEKTRTSDLHVPNVAR